MWNKYVGLILVLLVVLSFSGCAQKEVAPTQQAPAETSTPEGTPMGKGHGNGMKQGAGMGMNISYLRDYVLSIEAGALSDQEKEDILHMREEEKLARDVYLTLYDRWNQQIFHNIAQSEQTHMDAVKLLIEKYGLEDPAEGKDIGEFTNPKFQELYDQLVSEGSKSLVDALKVGAIIEELDIADLKECLNATDKLDITIVYENLMKGSRNHLRAFNWNLEKLGATYEPQYISKEEFEKIVNSEMERGMTQ